MQMQQVLQPKPALGAIDLFSSLSPFMAREKKKEVVVSVIVVRRGSNGSDSVLVLRGDDAPRPRFPHQTYRAGESTIYNIATSAIPDLAVTRKERILTRGIVRHVCEGKGRDHIHVVVVYPLESVNARSTDDYVWINSRDGLDRLLTEAYGEDEGRCIREAVDAATMGKLLNWSVPPH